jgi:hypothetical protein
LLALLAFPVALLAVPPVAVVAFDPFGAPA